MSFSAFTPLAGGNSNTYFYPAEYPYSLDAGLDFTRPATGISPFPYPLSVGHVEGNCGLFDQMWGMMSSTAINGMVLNILNANAMAQANIFPDLQGGLRKVLG